MVITLKAARVNTGLSLEEASQRIGVARSTLYSWEQGKTFPNVSQIRNIEKVYKVTYADIQFSGEN